MDFIPASLVLQTKKGDTFSSLLKDYAKATHAALEGFVDAYAVPTPLEPTAEAMKYALFLGGGGKRIRTVCAMLAALIAGADPLKALRKAVGVELIHTYTLILDDIQDGDELRRGEAATHVKFGFDAALMGSERLFARGMQFSMEASGSTPVDMDYVGALLEEVHRGQAADIASAAYGEDLRNLKAVEYIFNGKTGALFELAMYGGALFGGKGEAYAKSLGAFGKKLGFIFQASDDVLEHTSDEATLGKPVGKDRGQKLTYWTAFQAGKEAAPHLDRLVADLTVEAKKLQGDDNTYLESLIQAAAYRKV